jgi:hypothetical protein
VIIGKKRKEDLDAAQSLMRKEILDGKERSISTTYVLYEQFSRLINGLLERMTTYPGGDSLQDGSVSEQKSLD